MLITFTSRSHTVILFNVYLLEFDKNCINLLGSLQLLNHLEIIKIHTLLHRREKDQDPLLILSTRPIEFYINCVTTLTRFTNTDRKSCQ